MSLIALAGVAAFFDEEDVLGCFGLVVILPVVAVLIVLAWAADAPWAGWSALAVAGVAFLAASILVAGYMPSDDGDVLAQHEQGRRLVQRYGG